MLSLCARVRLGAAMAAALTGSATAGPVETVIHTFNVERNGQAPNSALTRDSAGNLYGTTFSGGANGLGTVYVLSPPAAGETAWTRTVIHSFGAADGGVPRAARLLIDKQGNLFGTTLGTTATSGTLFELTPPGAGQTGWTETVLYRFKAAAGGNTPSGALVADGAGAIYGTTARGGTLDGGTVFRLSPPAGGQGAWTQTVLYSFGVKNGDGYVPVAGLLVGQNGTLYGTTTQGGAAGFGAAFSLTPSGQSWTETLLYSFPITGGALPGALAGGPTALYGQTQGSLFKLTPPGAGGSTWTRTTLASLDSTGCAFTLFGLADAPLLGADGTLYATTACGGTSASGTALALQP